LKKTKTRKKNNKTFFVFLKKMSSNKEYCDQDVLYADDNSCACNTPIDMNIEKQYYCQFQCANGFKCKRRVTLKLGKNVQFCVTHAKNRFVNIVSEMNEYLETQTLNYTYYNMICNFSEFEKYGGCARRLRKQKVDFKTISFILNTLHIFFERLKNASVFEAKTIEFTFKNINLDEIISAFGKFQIAQILENKIPKESKTKLSKEFNDNISTFPSPYDVKNQLTLFQTFTRISIIFNEIKKTTEISENLIYFIEGLPTLLNSLTAENVEEIKHRVKVARWFLKNEQNDENVFTESIHQIINYLKKID
jgi:hypothetical protein